MTVGVPETSHADKREFITDREDFFGILRGAEFTTDRERREIFLEGRERNREVKVVGEGLAREVKRVKGKSRNWSKDFSLEASYGFEERSPKSESLSP